MIKWLEIALAFIALGVFTHLMITHAAPWWLVAIYWGTLTAKNFIPVWKNR